MTRRQRRWRGGVAASVVLAAAGVVWQNGVLVLAAALPLAYVAYGAVSRASPPDGVTAERTIDPVPARPGAVVTVSLIATNDTDRTLPDVRIADGVPEAIAVVDGTPRMAATLEPGERVETSYRVIAKRGEHPFGPPQVRTRGIGAGAVATTEAPIEGKTALVCRLDAGAPPLADHGDVQDGTLTTDEPGEGVTFHSVREYRPDDPAGRIDWRHYAKRGELATVNYEHSVSATVVLVVDARPDNHVVASEGRPTAVELQAYAATRAATDLLRAGTDVGVAVLGRNGPEPSGVHWLPPAGGAAQRERALALFRGATDDPLESVDATDQVRRVIDLAPAGAQLALFSPLLDDGAVSAVETWRGAGLPVVLLSVDVVPATTVSGQYAAVRRSTRLARCRATGARVFDWRRGTPLAVAIDRAFAADARVSADRTAGGVR